MELQLCASVYRSKITKSCTLPVNIPHFTGLDFLLLFDYMRKIKLGVLVETGNETTGYSFAACVM